MIRKLGRDDAEAWALLRREALEAHPFAFGAAVPDEPKGLIDVILARLAPPESVVFGAFSGSSLVGIVGIRREPGKKERHRAFLWGMYVTVGSRRNGVGGMLVRAACEEARTWSGVEHVNLSVSEVTPDAYRLYERNGFTPWGREPRVLCVEGRYADEIHMLLDLRERRT